MNNKLPKTSNQYELKALKDYCFNQFRDINLILREDISDKSEFDKKYQQLYGSGTTTESMYDSFLLNINFLDEMFEEVRNDNQLITYRKFASDKIPKLLVGESFIDKGYVSTSLEKENLKKVIHSDVLSYDSIAEIIVPKDTPCVYIGEIFGRKESELLLDRGLEYKLVDIKNEVFIFEINCKCKQ